MRLMLLAAALTAVPGAALAQPSDTLVVQGSRALADNQRLVGFGDLQLASASGQRELHSRVDWAITSLCDASHFSTSEPTASLKCTNQAWDDVAPQLARLTPRYASR